MSRIERALTEAGLELPSPPTPIANFVPFMVHGTTVYLAGQVNEWNGTVPYVGKVGREIDLDLGVKASELCALNLLACLKLACDGDLDRVRGCIQVRGFVNCDPEFEFVPAVINGASDLFVRILGDAGRHVRTAIGVASLPRCAAVEVDAVFEIR